MKKKILRILIVLLSLAASLAAAAGISAWVCTNTFSIRDYTVAIDGIARDTDVVLISDLHSQEFGAHNETLLAAVAEQAPDAIFLVGDMVNLGASEVENLQLIDLIARMQQIAQVYYSLGNTELDNIMNGGTDLLRMARETGAVALLDDYVEAEIGGNRVNVGFTMGHFRYNRSQWAHPPDYAMEYAVGADGTPAIVLMHMPESLFLDIHDQWTGDLYLCGHTHGGLWRIPGIGGVFAPTQRWFPKYDRGYFTFDEGRFQMIINPGLSGHGRIPRIFNMPEVSVIHITPGDESR